MKKLGHIAKKYNVPIQVIQKQGELFELEGLKPRLHERFFACDGDAIF